MLRFALIPATLALSIAPLARAEDEPLKQALALEAAIQQVVEKAEPSVACILVSRSDAYFREPFNQRPSGIPGKLDGFRWNANPTRPEETEPLKRLNLAALDAVPDSYGTGVVVDAREGLVLTNYHVIREATKIYIRPPGRGGSYADIFAADPRSDLAVLKLIEPLQGLRALTAGDSDAVKKGTFVLSLSNPWAAGFRDGSPSVAWGMLSNVRRRLPGEPNQGEKQRPRLYYYQTLLQTSLNVAPGASGGALLDLKGNWIGLLTALPGVAGGEATGGYAIPLDTRTKRIIDKLKKGEEVEYGFLGIGISPFRGRGGISDWSPTPGGPAARAGMMEGDQIVAINGEAILDTDDLMFNISASLAGTEISLVVDRGGRRVELRPVLVKQTPSGTGPIIAANRPAPVHGLRVDYTSVVYQGAGGHLRSPIPAGVLVREVEEKSPAAKADLRTDRDIITAVNGEAVSTPAEFYRAARKARAEMELTVREVDGPTRRVKLP